MKKEYMCYCGLYCENCGVKTKITPAASVLYGEMMKMGFDGVMEFIPGGGGFWTFLKGMVNEGICTSCREGGGNPNCKIRICAREKGVEMCALCSEYPCERFDRYFIGYDTLKADNLLLREKGLDAWGKLQDERRSKNFTYK